MGFGHGTIMRMLVVAVVHMGMIVLDGLMLMFVVVPLRQMQPKTQSHEQTGHYQLQTWLLIEDDQRNDGAKKRRECKIGAGSRCTQMPERKHEHHEADADGQEPKNGGARDDIQRRQVCTK